MHFLPGDNSYIAWGLALCEFKEDVEEVFRDMASVLEAEEYLRDSNELDKDNPFGADALCSDYLQLASILGELPVVPYLV